MVMQTDIRLPTALPQRAARLRLGELVKRFSWSLICSLIGIRRSLESRPQQEHLRPPIQAGSKRQQRLVQQRRPRACIL